MSSILRRQLKPRVPSIFGLRIDDAITMNEIRCLDPGCPVIETVILMMRPAQKTEAIKLAGAMSDVSDAQLLGIARPSERGA
jgi:hypothetical protein